MCDLIFILQILCETFLILRRIQRDIVINVHRSSCKVAVTLVTFERNLELSRQFWKTKKYQIWNFMKIRPVRAKFFHVDRQTDMTKVISLDFKLSPYSECCIISFWVIPPASEFYVPTFWNTLFHFRRTQPVKMEQNVSKFRHIKFRRRGIAQKKEYKLTDDLRNFENTPKNENFAILLKYNKQ
jgi:hypothetical protein